MTVTEAHAKIESALEKFAAPLREAGLDVITRVIYADKNLREFHIFDPKCILIFGDIAIGGEELERDEYCNYSMCCEIKTGLINDEDFTKELNNLDGEVEAFKEALERSNKPTLDLIRDINRKQEAEAEEAALDFSKQMNKLRLKMLIGIGIMILIILAVIVGIPLLSNLGE